jgi:hypothetical protein
MKALEGEKRVGKKKDGREPSWQGNTDETGAK